MRGPERQGLAHTGRKDSLKYLIKMNIWKTLKTDKSKPALSSLKYGNIKTALQQICLSQVACQMKIKISLFQK